MDKALYDRRKDLRMTGRTLFGAKPPRAQELHDHYYGANSKPPGSLAAPHAGPG